MNLGRRFVGCDNDIEFGYYEIAKRRIRAAVDKRNSSFRIAE